MPLDEALSDQDAALVIQQSEGVMMNVESHGDGAVPITDDGHVQGKDAQKCPTALLIGPHNHNWAYSACSICRKSIQGLDNVLAGLTHGRHEHEKRAAALMQRSRDQGPKAVDGIGLQVH